MMYGCFLPVAGEFGLPTLDLWHRRHEKLEDTRRLGIVPKSGTGRSKLSTSFLEFRDWAVRIIAKARRRKKTGRLAPGLCKFLSGSMKQLPRHHWALTRTNSFGALSGAPLSVTDTVSTSPAVETTVWPALASVTQVTKLVEVITV